MGMAADRIPLYVKYSLLTARDNRARYLFSRTYQRPQLRRGRSLLIRAYQNATSRSFVVTEQLQHEWNRR